jgi:hypothetical protein
LLTDDEACRVFDLRKSPIAALLDSILPPDEPVVTLVREHAHLALGARNVTRVTSLAEVKALNADEARFMVIPASSPWGPPGPEVLRSVECTYRKVLTRAGMCELFDLAHEPHLRLGRRSRGRVFRGD